MKGLVRAAEAAHGALFALALGFPLALFFWKVAPWQGDVSQQLSQPSIQAAIVNSIWLAVSVALVSTALAFKFSWVLWRFAWPKALSGPLELALRAPYLLPAFFLAIGWIALAAPGVGYLNRALSAVGLPMLPAPYGLGGAIFVETLWSTALAMIQLKPFFEQFPGQLEDAAVMCGAGPTRSLVKITLPLAQPYLISCLLLTAVAALASFGVPAMLASPARSFVLTTRIYQSIKGGSDFALAGTLSLTLLVLSLSVIVVQRVLRRASVAPLVGGKASRPSRLRPTAAAHILLTFAGFFALLSFALPCLAIVTQSLLRDPSDLGSWSLDKYRYVFTQAPEGALAVRTSFVSSLLAAGIATVLGLVLAYGSTRLRSRPARLLREAWGVGYALPGTVIALALLVAYSGSLTDTIWILVVAYLAKYAAFALRTLEPAIGAVSRELEEAAWMSGASPVRAFFKAMVPLLKPALAASVFLAFVPMLSELTMSVFLVGAGTETIGSMIYRLQEYADPGSAAVLAVLVATVILALNFVIKRLSRGSFGI